MGIIDKIATVVADKVNAQNDEVMLLTQENERLQRDYDAKAYTVKQLENKLKDANKTIQDGHYIIGNMKNNSEKIASNNKELKRELARVKNNYDELSKKKTSKESKKQITKLKQVNANQLKFIEILQTIASAKSDKTQLKDVFSHNLSIYLDNNFNTVKQASDKLGINRTTLSELRSGKIALSYDNLDILDSKLCEYFECSVYELVTVKLNKEASQ
ncbi:helix-turn-helix domain-containing protein [Vagococcus carniphilus]|uniref:helix-turn-helix domain-containing protein n=1 Tax=Vagococcus carniphilus TaxID=218144 RepID=UPI002891ADEA|nr:helix-turn-helix transcriptional regulator [Vagococcus carniphilus]MDT2864669.1 helix-turn-helix transcriptional regulator [Vagococcus carniphilus]